MALVSTTIYHLLTLIEKICSRFSVIISRVHKNKYDGQIKPCTVCKRGNSGNIIQGKVSQKTISCFESNPPGNE
jgi:hypothetical protein